MMSFEELKKQYPHLVSETARLVCGEGWLPIVERFLREIAVLPRGSVTVTDFYEKYGSLRVDYDTSGLSAEDSAVFDKAEILAESRSYRLCETCGRPGHLRDERGWLFVACDAHSKNRDALGRHRSHTFDLEALLVDGTRHAIAVKYESQVETSGIGDVVRLIDEQRPKGCADFIHLRTDRQITEIRANNARLVMRAYRFRVQEHVDQMRAFVSSFNGTATIAEIVKATIPGSDGYLALLCLIAEGDIVAVGEQPISMSTSVRLRNGYSAWEGI